jgi:hypothetical protein
METEPQKPREETSAPSRKVRLAWWFGIYLFGNLVYLFIANMPGHTGSTSDWTPAALLKVPLFFPWGLAMPLYSLSLQTGIDLTLGFFLILVYSIYGIHFGLTWKAQRRRTFQLLMYSLILLVSTNIAGCKEVEKESRDSQAKTDQEVREADKNRQEENQQEQNVPEWDKPQNRP